VPALQHNADLCKKIGYDIGVSTHNFKSYSKALRPAAAREWGVTDKHSVKYVRPRSPADYAGLKQGDHIIGPNGEALSARSKGLQKLLAQGQAELSIRRGNEVKSVAISSDPICAYSVHLRMNPTVNAYATGRAIIVTSGMMDFAKTDEELALIVGHELAHNTMKHIRKSVTNAVLSGMAHRYTRPFESEADYVGLYYLVRAGYNPDNVESIWRRMASINPRSVARAKTHPTFPDRFLRIRAAQDEIKAKKLAGLPLIPNFVDAKSEEKYAVSMDTDK